MYLKEEIYQIICKLEKRQNSSQITISLKQESEIKLLHTVNKRSYTVDCSSICRGLGWEDLVVSKSWKVCW